MSNALVRLSPWNISLVVLWSVLCLPSSILAQTLVNGQVFTNGLAILDAPAPQSVQHAGSNMPIAIDISGDGKLSQAASVPGSGLPTSFDTLEIYLVSSQAKLNITVSSGPTLLTQESGSTVKHLNWPIPNCLPSGSYNFTLYESSHFNGSPYFSITPVPISIENTNVNGSCTDVNTLLAQPQPSSPPPQNPWLGASGPITVTIGPSGIMLPSTMKTVTIPQATTVTMVMVSLETITSTSITAGSTEVFTTIVASSSTTTVAMKSGSLEAGFVPVNGASSLNRRGPLGFLPSLGLLLLLLGYLY
ncbi:hypothetical protein JAAARDRAFT_203154 [Jaapia argillacea MUCL 33604]|uniref:Uncharacterized protein n=1 Tax=Jaapia argillacea MUCL 33604 TaxID=933084 RepID=A0A067QC72_9AGAM|nr:hypothetical protein JAAARDRAFT_203154 [Jaapia argillacea MUCL 33604]